MTTLRKPQLIELIKIYKPKINESMTVPKLKAELNSYLNLHHYKKYGRNHFDEMNEFINNEHHQFVYRQYERKMKAQQKKASVKIFVSRNEQYQQELQEYRREREQEESNKYWKQQQEQQAEEAKRIMNEEHDFMLLQESKKFTKPINFQQNKENFISATQNQEMAQKIRKYKGQHVEEIEIETSSDDQTLLLFPPVDQVKFIDGVRRARKGFQRKREIVDVDGVSPIYYDNYIDSLDAIDKHVEFVYNEQRHRAFKILFNFGVIIEELEHDKNGQEIITYKYRLPREDTVQTHIPKNILSNEDIEEYKQYIRAEIIEMQNFNLENTKQRYVAIYSMMIKVFKLQKTVVGTSMQELIQKHWEGHRQILFKNNGEYNLCYMEAIAKALHPDTQEKRCMPNNIISLAREYLVQVLDLPLKAKSKQMTKYLKTFEGLDYQKYSQIITQKLQVNQNIYFYDEDSKAYYLGQKIIYVEYDEMMKDEQPEIPTVDILIVQASNLQHAFAIANKEALTGLKFCPFCQVKGFDTKNSNYIRDYEKHIVKCEQRGGKLVKTIKLDQIQKPYVPHIVQNKTFAYLLAHGREQEFKPTQYYITYDLETVEKIVNKSFGKSSKQISELVPLSVASTIKNKTGIKTIYYDLRNGDDFINQWLNQLFNEAVIVQQDNQYRTQTGVIDKAMQYNVDVPVIGFNSSKFDFSLIFKNLQCADWSIKSYIGSSGVAKQIVVQHKKLDVKLKFIDILTYYIPITLKEFAKTFNQKIESQKGVFPYEYINTDNYKEILKQQEPFPIEAFNSTLKNTQITQEDYDVYANNAKQFKNRWEYLQYYNEQDTKIMIEPINKLIEMNRKYNIDMFSFMSMAACSNATKYACIYKDFNVNDNYPVINDTSPRFVLQQQYWNSKVLSYEVQDKCQKRDTTDNVKEQDFEYFKQLFKVSKCAICGDEFTMNNKPTLDRINNLKGHSKDNVQQACLYCNCFCSNKDKDISKLFIQLRRYCSFNCLPTYLTDIDVYKLIRKWITGGLSNVMNRVNVAGQDFIKKFQFSAEARGAPTNGYDQLEDQSRYHGSVRVITSDYQITHIIGIDFNSLYPSVMSSEQHKFIKYTSGKMYMPGSVSGKIICDSIENKQKILDIINSQNKFNEHGQLFIAEVKGHIDENHLNDYINFPPILRNYEFQTNEETIDEYMYQHMKSNGIKVDQKQRKLTNLLSTYNGSSAGQTMGQYSSQSQAYGYMSFSSYYL